MTRPAPHRKSSFLRQHSLSLIVAAILSLLLVLYSRADPSTRWGSFFGNAVADWTGTFVFIIATKYFFEVGSRESRRPTKQFHQRFAEFLLCHSLTIVLGVTGLAWIYAYAHSEPNGKWGQVTGNIVSEWTQVLGLVVATKYFREAKSKE